MCICAKSYMCKEAHQHVTSDNLWEVTLTNFVFLPKTFMFEFSTKYRCFYNHVLYYVFFKVNLTGCSTFLETTATSLHFQWIILDTLHFISPLPFADFKLQQRN